MWAASKISGKQIKKNSIPGNRIKKKTLTNDRIKKKTLTNDRIKPGTIQRSALAAGALPGLTVADASASNLPGATTKTPPGPDSGGAHRHTPCSRRAAGRATCCRPSFVGNPVFNPPDSCFIGTQVYVNGIPVTFVNVFSNEPEPGFDSYVPGGQRHDQPADPDRRGRAITAKVFGDPNCGAGTSLDKLRITVTELG